MVGVEGREDDNSGESKGECVLLKSGGESGLTTDSVSLGKDSIQVLVIDQ